MSGIQNLKAEFMGGGVAAMIFVGTIVVAFLVGLFSIGGALLLMALGLLATVCADFVQWRRSEQPSPPPSS